MAKMTTKKYSKKHTGIVWRHRIRREENLK